MCFTDSLICFSDTTIRYFIPTVRHYYSFPVYIFHKMVDHVSPVWTFWSKFYADLTTEFANFVSLSRIVELGH